MKPVLMFATGIEDAMAECDARLLVFSKIVWLRGPEYMPGADLNDWDVIKTAAYILQEGEPVE